MKSWKLWTVVCVVGLAISFVAGASIGAAWLLWEMFG